MEKYTYFSELKPTDIEIEGDAYYGDDVVLVEQEENLIKNSMFNDQGYIVTKFLDDDLLNELRSEIFNKISKDIEKALGIKIASDNLANYHQFVSDEDHLKAIKAIYFSSGGGHLCSDFKFDFTKIEDRVSEICNEKDLVCKSPSGEHRIFLVRLVRPTVKTDANPPHRDVWIDRLKNAVNIHFALAGGNSQSTMGLVPGSHYWKESEIKRTANGAQIKGVQYQVPTVVETKRKFNIIRPRLYDNDVLVFSPYLIHGGMSNTSDVTRISLEMRFWKKS